MVALDPEDVRPHKDQPFYHLLAENSESEYVAYVSEQNLLPDDFSVSRSGTRRLPRFSSRTNPAAIGRAIPP